MFAEIDSNFFLAYSVYLMGVLSPGVANLTIMQHAMQYGRQCGLAMAFGVASGSIVWGISSAFGLGTLFLQYPTIVSFFGLFGTSYFAWLSYGAFQTARTHRIKALDMREEQQDKQRLVQLYFKGLAIHLTNPKAFFVWVSIVALGLSEEAISIYIPLLIVFCCGITGLLLFSTMGFLFSTARAIRTYQNYGVLINSLLTAMFLFASISLFYRSLGGLF